MWNGIIMFPLIFSNLQDDKETPLPAPKKKKISFKIQNPIFHFLHFIILKFSLDKNVKVHRDYYFLFTKKKKKMG